MKTSEGILPPASLQDAHTRQVPEERKMALQEMALLELEQTSSNALCETLEEMGMAMAGRVLGRKDQGPAGRQARKQQALVKLVQSGGEQGAGVARILALAPQDRQALEMARQIVALSSRLAQDTLSQRRKQGVSAKLAALMAQQGWETTLFAMMEMGEVDPASLRPITRLMQQALDEPEVSLMEWFKRIAGWRERRQRLRVLLRVMAFELSACLPGQQQQRLAAVLQRLRRLLLFLGLENECRRIEGLCRLPTGTLLPLTIEIVGESWLFADWLNARLATLKPPGALRNRLIHHLATLYTLLPDGCFMDDDQREQIIGVLRQLAANQV
uniref:Putative type III secretion system protein SsaL n=1 Tax=Candidatus Sodalis melophagi TaxID=1173031 RepID=I6PDY2_9GAMM|nr:putative type III secretion system protein SsaL [Candidatus Sodalis melophagi]